MWEFGLTAFVTLMVIVDPLGMLPIFIGLTGGMESRERHAVLRRAILVALLVAILFLIAGDALLRYMGVSMNAFSISGGILLFVTAMPMLFGARGGLQSPQKGEEATPDHDIAIFPMAIPLLVGPGVMTSLLLLMAQAHGERNRVIALFVATTLVFLLAWCILLVGERVLQRVSEAGIHVATRVLGIVLAALAVQFVLNGITGFYHSLVIK